MVVTDTQVRNQLGGVGTDEVSTDVVTQAISQATTEVDARARSGAPDALVEDAKIKVAAYYAWSAYIKSGRFELGEIREEGFDIMMENYKLLADGAMRLVCTQHITLSTDWHPLNDDDAWNEEE